MSLLPCQSTRVRERGRLQIGTGSDERARAATHRGAVEGSGAAHDGCLGGAFPGHDDPPGPASAEGVQSRRRRSTSAQGSRTTVEPSMCRRHRRTGGSVAAEQMVSRGPTSKRAGRGSRRPTGDWNLWASLLKLKPRGSTGSNPIGLLNPDQLPPDRPLPSALRRWRFTVPCDIFYFARTSSPYEGRISKQPFQQGPISCIFGSTPHHDRRHRTRRPW